MQFQEQIFEIICNAGNVEMRGENTRLAPIPTDGPCFHFRGFLLCSPGLLGVRVNPRLATDDIKWSRALKSPFYGGHMAQGFW